MEEIHNAETTDVVLEVLNAPVLAPADQEGAVFDQSEVLAEVAEDPVSA